MTKEGKLVGNDYCGAPDQIDSNIECTQFLDLNLLTSNWETQCANKETCHLDLVNYLKLTTQAPIQCKDTFTKIYLQYKCEMDQDNESKRMDQGYIIFFCGLVIATIYKFTIAFLDVTTNHNFKSWDAKTCTPADYTVELPITPKMWSNHKNHMNNPLPLDDHIRELLINFVKKLTPVEPDAKQDDVEIAVISYGYNNKNMIELLQKRGKFLGNGKINEFMKNESESRGLVLSNAQFERMKTPNRAFITFTTHDAALRVQKYMMRRDPISGKKNKQAQVMMLLG